MTIGIAQLNIFSCANKNAFLKYFNKIINTPGEYIPLVQHRWCRLPIEEKDEIEAQLKKWQIELKSKESSFTYSCKANDSLCICLFPMDITKAIIREHYEAPILE